LISNELGVSIPDTVRDTAECNCSFARQIEERALRNEVHSGATENLHDSLKFIVVHGRNQVQIMEISVATKSSITEKVYEELGTLDLKEVILVGGTTTPDAR